MDPEQGQRRRFVFALVVTAALIPAYFAIGRAESARDTLATATTAASAAGPNLGDDDVMGSIPLGYLTGAPDNTGGARPTIVIPNRPEQLTTKATFLREFTRPTACMIPGAPRDKTVTVINSDNGRGVQCNNTIDPIDYVDRANPEYAILAVEAYLKIADLTDVPVPVEVSW